MHVFSARAQTIESALHVARSALRLPFPTDNAYNRAHNRGLSALRPDGGSRGLEPRGNRSTRTGGATLAAPRHGDTAGSDLELVRQRACTSAGPLRPCRDRL